MGGPAPDLSHPKNQTVALRRHERATFNDPQPVVELVRRNAALDDERAEQLEYALNELFQNTADHSASPIGGISCARFSDDEVRFALVDLGIGIRGSLVKRHPEVRDDFDALVRLGRPGLSARSRENNAGQGLDLVRSITLNTGGEFVVVSGRALAHIDAKAPSWKVDSATGHLPGTAVLFMMPVSDR